MFGEVDHFIPWSRYPCDSPFYLVLARKRENQRLRDALKPAAMRQRWERRNDTHLSALVAPEREGGFGAGEQELELVRAVAGWVYGCS